MRDTHRVYVYGMLHRGEVELEGGRLHSLQQLTGYVL